MILARLVGLAYQIAARHGVEPDVDVAWRASLNATARHLEMDSQAWWGYIAARLTFAAKDAVRRRVTRREVELEPEFVAKNVGTSAGMVDLLLDLCDLYGEEMLKNVLRGDESVPGWVLQGIRQHLKQ